MDRPVLVLSILVSAFMMVVTSRHLTEPAGQEYWKKVLPNTPMPRAIKNLLTRAGDDVCKDSIDGVYNKCKSKTKMHKGVGVAIDDVYQRYGNQRPAHSETEMRKGGVVIDDVYQRYGNQRYGDAHSETEMRKGGVVIDDVYQRYGNQKYGDAHSETEMRKGGVVIDDVYQTYGNQRYSGAHGGTKTHYDADIAIFFLPKDLRTGTNMTLHFTDPSVSSATFISRREADSLPFTSSKLPDILNHFSIEPRSNEAAAMRQTLANCEEAALEGEKKYCATSLESMIDFSVTSLGSRDVVALSTSVDKENSPKQQFEITSFRARKKMAGYNSVVCHASSYAYAVFYCHTTTEAETYHVSLVGKDGTNVEAVATCHTDTSGWDPAYIAFQMLGVKPGTVPVCHFLPQNHVVWTPK